MMRTSCLGLVCLAACANNVPQDRSTGPDGRIKGAQPIALEEGEAKVRGIVTYPGGDRVDWKLIELPAGKRGTLDLQMSWTTPRPGLKVAFDVFDQWNVPVINATSNKRGGRMRSASIDRAKGTYFVRIYAPRRGDAGAYTLQAAFTPDLPPPVLPQIEIPDPPRLPDVPPPPSTCETHDPTDRACDKVCAPGAPPTWKGCVAPPPPPPVATTTVTPPVQVPDPIVTRVLKFEITADGLELTVAAGSAHGVGKGWKANVLRGTTMSTLAGGYGTIVRVNKQTTIVRVNLTTNAINANPQVQLSP